MAKGERLADRLAAAADLKLAMKMLGLDTVADVERWLLSHEGEVHGGFRMVRVGVDPVTGENLWQCQKVSDLSNDKPHRKGASRWT